VVVGLLVPLTASTAVQAAPPDNYVALGDSYAAGPLIPMPIQPWGCLKSDHNYGHLLAPKLGLPAFRDVTCSGAETEDMTHTQGVTPGPNPPQFDALDESTKIVTLQIGGNDIGFSSLAQDCFSPSPVAGSPCKDLYTAGGTDQVDARIAAAGPDVGAAIEGIKARSPQAEIYMVNYSAIFPHTGGGELCWPNIPVSWGDIPWLRQTQERLNAMLANQAALHGAHLVDIYAASVGHDACQPPVLRWIEPLVPVAGAPVHPNLVGMLAFADIIYAATQN
jgi:lysophospholipase L1-like esterase